VRRDRRAFLFFGERRPVRRRHYEWDFGERLRHAFRVFMAPAISKLMTAPPPPPQFEYARIWAEAKKKGREGT